MSLRYTAEAREDLDIAFEWYEGQRRGLGFEFLDCVEAAIETILQMPKLYAKQHDSFRRTLVLENRYQDRLHRPATGRKALRGTHHHR